LRDDEALLIKADELFTDNDNFNRTPGDIWMVHGPNVYIPPVEVTIIEQRYRV